MILNFNVNDFDITRTADTEIISDSVNYIKCKFTVTGALNIVGGVFSAVFKNSDNISLLVPLDDNMECYLPKLNPFRFMVGLHVCYVNSSGNSVEVSTKNCIVRLSPAAYNNGTNAFNTSEYAELLLKIQQLENDIDSIDLDSKADKTYVDTELDKKSNINHAHSEYALSEHYHSQYLTEHQDISGKADLSYVNSELSGKSDTGHTHSQYLTEHQDISGKEDKSTISTQQPQNNTLLANTEYYIGEQATLSIAFEDLTSNDKGKYIYLCFKSGSTATNLTVDTSNTTDFDFAPSADSICEIMGKWNGEIWLLISNEMTVTTNE